MNTYETVEIIADTLEPGGPVHEAAYNILSSLKKNASKGIDLDPTQAHALTKIVAGLKHFASLDVEEQWGLEERFSHVMTELCRTMTS